METTPRCNLIWSGAPLDPSGYGEASREYLTALEKNHADQISVRLKPKYFFAGERPNMSASMLKMLRTMADRSHVKGPVISLQHLTPENYVVSTSVDWHIAMTTFETDSVPNHWQMHLRGMDEIVVFSEFNKQVFESTGIRRPITVVPHGVDSDRFHPGAAPMAKIVEKCQGSFVFGSNFDWTARKNPEALLNAYFAEFKHDEPVCLVLKVYHQGAIDKSLAIVQAKIAALAAKAGLGPGKTPRVLIIGGIFSPEDMPSFYTSLDCYVLPSRGEGWSLTHSEAMSCGIPSIGVNWGGNTEFMDDTNSMLLKNYKLRQITAADEVPAHYFGHRWADCDVDELRVVMRRATTLRQRPSWGLLKTRCREEMVEKFSWKQAGAKLAALINQRAQVVGTPVYVSAQSEMV